MSMAAVGTKSTLHARPSELTTMVVGGVKASRANELAATYKKHR